MFNGFSLISLMVRFLACPEYRRRKSSKRVFPDILAQRAPSPKVVKYSVLNVPTGSHWKKCLSNIPTSVLTTFPWSDTFPARPGQPLTRPLPPSPTGPTTSPGAVLLSPTPSRPVPHLPARTFPHYPISRNDVSRALLLAAELRECRKGDIPAHGGNEDPEIDAEYPV